MVHKQKIHLRKLRQLYTTYMNQHLRKGEVFDIVESRRYKTKFYTFATCDKVSYHRDIGDIYYLDK